jgi:hypothetical protein
VCNMPRMSGFPAIPTGAAGLVRRWPVEKVTENLHIFVFCSPYTSTHGGTLLDHPYAHCR